MEFEVGEPFSQRAEGAAGRIGNLAAQGRLDFGRVGFIGDDRERVLAGPEKAEAFGDHKAMLAFVAAQLPERDSANRFVRGFV